MTQPLPPPIGANRVGDDDDAPAELRGLSARARLVVAAMALVAALVAGIIGYRVIAGGDDDGDDGLPGWNAVATQSVDDDAITVYDRRGDELDSFRTSASVGTIAGNGRYVLTQTGESASIIDVTDGTSTEVELAGGARARFLGPTSTIVAVSSPNSANARLIAPATDLDVDIAEVASLDDPQIIGEAIRADVEEQVVGLVDERTFQSVLISVDPDADAEPVFLPGRLADLRHGSALTLQVVGERAEMTFRDLDGDELGTVEVPSLRAAMLTDSASALVFTSGGELLEVSASREQPRGVASLDVADDAPGAAVFLRAAERFLYASRDGETVIVDLEGEEVLREAGTPRFAVVAGTEALGCVAVAGSDDSGGDGPAETRLYDLQDGDLVGDPFESDRLGLASSADGCVVGASTSDGSSITSEAGTTAFADDLVAVAPDGSAYLVRSDERTLVLRQVGSDDEGFELDAVVGAFVER